MDRAAVVTRVSLLGACEKKPTLDATAVGTVVDGMALYDAAGTAPGAVGWVPTYNVNGAVAEVWRVKAAQVAGDFTFTADDGKFEKGDLLAHMLTMEQKYAQLAASDMTARAGGAGTLNVAGTNGPFSTLDQIAREVIP